MNGFEHLNNKVECPRCKYTFFDIVLINELSTIKARCRHCGFTTDGIGGVQGHLEELVRSLLPLNKPD